METSPKPSEPSPERAQARVTSAWGRGLVALSDTIDQTSKVCFVFGMAAFAGIMLLGVFFRYVLNDSLA